MRKLRLKHVIQFYFPRVLDIRLQEDWTRDAGEGFRVLMSLRVDFRFTTRQTFIYIG